MAFLALTSARRTAELFELNVKFMIAFLSNYLDPERHVNQGIIYILLYLILLNQAHYAL